MCVNFPGYRRLKWKKWVIKMEKWRMTKADIPYKSVSLPLVVATSSNHHCLIYSCSWAGLESSQVSVSLIASFWLYLSESDWPHHNMSSIVTILNWKIFHDIWWQLDGSTQSETDCLLFVKKIKDHQNSYQVHVSKCHEIFLSIF